MDRRSFMHSMALGAGLAMAAGHAAAQESAPGQNADVREGDMIYRTLGKTGEKVSIIGLGGYHIGIQKTEQESIDIIRAAIDGGINFMDNCWDYNQGQSEIRMGKALQDGYRDKVFLMTKVDGRTKESAARQLDECLQRLQTDRIDLLQFHEMIRVEDADRIFAKGGAIEALKEAQQAGKIRYIGFTGHKDPFIHLRTLEVADQHGFEFDAVQMPLNIFDAHFRSFEKLVLPELTRRGIGVLGMKPMASGAILKTQVASPVECLHYAMSLPTSVVITGMDSMDLLKQGLQAARDFKGLTDSEMADLRSRTVTLAATGEYERFKTGTQFDATSRHFDWLG